MLGGDGVLDRERTEEIIRLRTKGETLSGIGDKFGLTGERVRQICVRHGMACCKQDAIDLLAAGLPTDMVIHTLSARYKLFGIKTSFVRCLIEKTNRSF